MVWDLRLQVKYHIVTVAAAVTVLYTVLFKSLPLPNLDKVLILLIFSDPSMLGFLFIGVLILFEKGANTLPALVVTPLRAWQYLWAKTLSLTCIALACSFGMAVVGHGWSFGYGYLLLAVFFSSVLFLMIGFVGVARVKTFNQYLLIIPLFLAPLSLPLLHFFGVSDWAGFYLIPTQASLLLFQAAFGPVAPWQVVYAVLYLPLACLVAYRFARQAYVTRIIGG
jgi:fluoroquinolone transport system permease protein